MTDRRIERSVSSQLAALEERTRGLEAIIGGGTQRAIKSDDELTPGSTSSSTFTDLVDSGATTLVGPEVTVTVGHVGNLFVLWTATIETNFGDVGYGSGGAVTFELRRGGTIVQAAATSFPFLLVSVPFTGLFLTSKGTSKIVTGLEAGDYTVRLKYKAYGSGRVDFQYRTLQAFPF